MSTKTRSRRPWSVAACLTLAVGAAVGTTSAGASPRPSESTTPAPAAGGNFIVNIGTPPANLDPARGCSLQDIALISDLYATLVRYDVKGEGVNQSEDGTKIVGYIAKDWSMSDDGLTYTFNLREDAKFASGAPITADAVKYTYDRAMAQKDSCGGYFAQAGQMPDGVVASVEVKSPTQVVYTLKRPEPLFIHAMAIAANGIIDPTVLDANGGKEGAEYLLTHSAGAGPYTVDTYEPGTKLVLKTNPNYFGEDKPKHDTVTINFITAPETLALEAPNADVTIGLPAAAANDLKSNSAVQVVSTPQAAWEAVYLPTKSAPFDNPKVRAALAMAVPYQDILDKVAYGFGQTFYGPYPPALPGYTDGNGKAIETNVDEAKKMLEGIDISDTPLEIVVREGVPEEEELAQALQAAWDPLGLKVAINKVPAADYFKQITTPDKKFAVIRNDGPAVASPLWMLDYDLPCGSPYNVSNWCSPETDDLLKQAHAELDEGKRQAILDKLAEVWRAATPRIPLYAVNQTVVLKAGAKDFVSSSHNYPFHLWG